MRDKEKLDQIGLELEIREKGREIKCKNFNERGRWPLCREGEYRVCFLEERTERDERRGGKGNKKF